MIGLPEENTATNRTAFNLYSYESQYLCDHNFLWLEALKLSLLSNLSTFLFLLPRSPPAVLIPIIYIYFFLASTGGLPKPDYLPDYFKKKIDSFLKKNREKIHPPHSKTGSFFIYKINFFI